MTFNELYREIELPEEVIEQLRQVAAKVSIDAVEPQLQAMMTPPTAAEGYRTLTQQLGQDPGCFKMLYCQLECARRDADRYADKGISQEVFRETMKCFTRFLHECDKMRGHMEFDRGWWTYRQISMILFRVGALEYEWTTRDGQNMVSLHIPSDADLTPPSVDRSLAQANDFIQRYWPEYANAPIMCDSWLLSPVLRKLLPPESNILRFQSRFTLLDVDTQDRGFIEWLFQSPQDADILTLPVQTHLQRNAKALLLDGGSVGSARGILKQESRK